MLGTALYDSGLSEPDLQALLEAALPNGNASEQEFARGLIAPSFHFKGKQWGEQLISKALDAAWGRSSVLAILLAIPSQEWTWGQAHRAGDEIEEDYWKAVPVFWPSDQKDIATPLAS